MSPGAPGGQAVVLDGPQLQALLAKTFNVGLDVGRGKEPVALVRLRLAKALIGVADFPEEVCVLVVERGQLAGDGSRRISGGHDDRRINGQATVAPERR